MSRRASILAALALVLGTPAAGRAQSTTVYHLHKEASAINSANKQLKTIGPDATQTALQTVNLKNSAGNFASLIAYFETQSSVPNRSGTIAVGSVVSFGLYMKVTHLPSTGNVYPHAILRLNTSTGPELCRRGEQDGLPALTLTLTLYTFTCTTRSTIAMTTSDRFFLEAGVWIAGTMGNQNLYGELDIETNADSTVTAPNPAPTITSVNPVSGIVNDAVAITGTAFGTSGSVTFNGTTATTSSWTNTTIQTSVPAAVAPGSGPVVVTVNGVPSNGATFTALPHVTSISPGGAAAGQSVTIAGTTFGAVQGTVTFNGTPAVNVTSWNNTSIGVTVPAGATTGPVVVTAGGSASNGFTFTVITTGTIAGTITRATGGSAIAGATVQAVLVGVIRGTATTAGNGTYSIANLDAGTYDVRVSATGFSSEVRSGTSVAANQTSTVNVAMLQPGSISGVVTQASGGAPIGGAAVTLYSGPVPKASTSTDANGNYSVANLHPGAYTVQAADVGFRTKQQGATISENASTVSSLALDPAATGPVSYVYDELSRLVSVIDPSGDAANYQYDKVGNLLSIARPGASTVSISEFTPNSGPVGAAVTIYGTGFSSTPSSNIVTFGGIGATVTSASANQLTVTASGGGQIAVSAPNGSANTGSVSFIVNSTAGLPTITSISPQIWDGISALTIAGTNFDTAPANDRVNLNVDFATPATAGATSLSVPVPAAATSGRVTVATVAGTAVSASDFFIPPPGYVAANVQSTGRITIGSSQTVSIPTAGKFAMLLFDGAPEHRVSATFTNVTLGSGTGAIYDPYGLVRSTGLSNWSGSFFIDAFAMPTSATYTLLVASTGASTGNTTVTLYDVVDVVGTIVAGGASQPVTIGTPGQNARLTFSETAGHRISLDMTSTIGGLGDCTVVTITKPDGNPMVTNSCVTNQGGFIDTQSIPATGTYTIAIDPPGSATGTLTLTLYDVPADTTGTITAGGASQTVTLGTPGQNGSLTFTGTNLERVSLNMTNVTIGGFGTCTVVTINKPDGTPLVSNGCVTTQGGFIDVQTLTAAGTYTIVIDPQGSATGSMTLALYDVADATGSVTINGAALPVTLSVPGQNANITVAGTVGQSIRIPVTTPGFNVCATVTLLRQDNVTSVASISSCGNTITLPSTSLPATETYHVVLDPSGAVTGNYTISVVSP